MQAARVGPMCGQFGHFFKFAKDKTTDAYALNRYTIEEQGLLDVLDGFYAVAEQLKLTEFEHVARWRTEVTSRPAYQRGKRVCTKS